MKIRLPYIFWSIKRLEKQKAKLERQVELMKAFYPDIDAPNNKIENKS